MLISRFLSKFQTVWLRRNYKRMSGLDCFAPPEKCKGMTILIRDDFKKEIKVPCLTIPANQNLHKVIPTVKGQLLKLRHMKPIRDSDDGKNKKLLLNPEQVKEWTDLPADKLGAFTIDQDALGTECVEMSYENYHLKDILKGILPHDQEGVSSFSQVGHIVHVNLRDEMLPYKDIIGQVLLDHVANCKSVVNKLNSIDNVYRNFQLELLAGEDNYKTLVKENGVSFEFDFSKVYWNSRLSTEHERIVQSVNPGDVVYDVFAGVGPFAVPIAKKVKCPVLANDLNPESAKWLEHNKKLNKIGDNLRVCNKDAKDFILNDVKADLEKELIKETPRTLRVVMNLPELGKEFLKYFIGLINNPEIIVQWNAEKVPILINVYCFVRGEDLKLAAKEAVEEQLRRKLKAEEIQGIAFVRNVAPNKDMMRVSFYLTKEMIGGEVFWNSGEKRKLTDNEMEEVVEEKKICVE